MKILRHTGQKVLEAPINSDCSFYTEEKGKIARVNLTTVDKQAKYALILEPKDMLALSDILFMYQFSIRRWKGDES